MPGKKTRPRNNLHHFVGLNRTISFAEAAGFELERADSMDGTRIKYKLDEAEGKGFATQNGGITMPSEKTLHPGCVYFRFVRTEDYNLKASHEERLWGRWWVSESDFWKIVLKAQDSNMELSRTAREMLVLPWGDCRYFGAARLNTALRAWAGPGKFATRSISPSSEKRNPANPDHRLWGDPVHLQAITQMFIPYDHHDRKFFDRMFQFLLITPANIHGHKVSDILKRSGIWGG